MCHNNHSFLARDPFLRRASSRGQDFPEQRTCCGPFTSRFQSQREAKEHPLSFLIVRGLSGVTIVANSLNHPISQSSSGGLRRGITVAIVGSGIGFLLAFTGLTTYSARTDGGKVPKSTIGKTGEMKSPGGSAYINETQN